MCPKERLTRKEDERFQSHEDYDKMDEEETKLKEGKLLRKRLRQMDMPALEALLTQHEETLDPQAQESLKICYTGFYESLKGELWYELDRILYRLKDLIVAVPLIGSIVVKMGMAIDILYLLTDLPPEYDSLKENGLWVMINLTASITEDIAILAEQGCVPLLVDCLQTDNEQIQESVMWTLANIAGEEDPRYRDEILGLEVLSWMQANLTKAPRRVHFLRIVTWLISNLFRSPLVIPAEEAIVVLPLLLYWLNIEDSEIDNEALNSLALLCETGNERVVEEISKPLVFLKILRKVRTLNSHSLRLIDYLKAQDIALASPYVDKSDLKVLRDLLYEKDASVRLKICHIFSIFLVEGLHDPTLILTHDIMPRVIELAFDDDIEMRENALECLANFVQRSAFDNVQYLVSQGLIGAVMANLADHKQTKIITNCLLVISSLLECGEKMKRNSTETNVYATLISRSSLWQLLEGISEQEPGSVQCSALELLNKYFLK